ncbi:MAG: UvrD-helicase domain-containing protein, partial [Actinomycetota bacterium]
MAKPPERSAGVTVEEQGPANDGAGRGPSLGRGAGVSVEEQGPEGSGTGSGPISRRGAGVTVEEQGPAGGGAGSRPILGRSALITSEPIPSGSAFITSGPILGRSALITTEQPVPEGWRGLPVIELAPGAPEQLIEQVEEHHRNRNPVVIRLKEELPDPSLAVVAGPVWDLHPAFDFPIEHVVHYATANSVDFRRGRGRWPWAERAMAMGAAPGGDAPLAEPGTPGGDVILPDGRPALCDGGPLAYLDPTDPGVGGRPVIHRVALEAGALTPFEGNGTEADLAPDQLSAVTATGAAARIIAPAGAGKTRVLTERARHLLRAWRVPPSAVCLVAYNRRAAGEMKQRTADLPELQIRTLNSLGLSILSGTGVFGGGNRPIRTLEEREVREILDRLVSFRRRANTDPAAAWIEALSAIRLGLHSPAQIEDQFNGELEDLGRVFDDYRAELASLQAVDYDEQIYGALELLLTD